jgi:hypothetical protein
VKSNCCLELDLCVDNAPCQCLVSCLQGGNNQLQCDEMCGGMRQQQLFASQLLACTNFECDMEC